jgi:aprataxin
MAPKHAKKNLPPQTHPQITKSKAFDVRDGLGIYIEHPEKFFPSPVIQFDDEFVVIIDKYPKAT